MACSNRFHQMVQLSIPNSPMTLKEKIEEAIENTIETDSVDGSVDIEQAAEAAEKIADEYAIAFADWVAKNYTKVILDDGKEIVVNYKTSHHGTYYTINNLIQIFKSNHYGK